MTNKYKTATQETIAGFAEHAKQAQVSYAGYFYGEFNCVWQGKQNELPLGMVWLKGENTTNWSID